jgi:PST family polysaccharide transporter
MASPNHLSEGLFHRSVRGAQLITVTTVITAVAQLGSQIVLMRLLTPEVFGAAAYIVVIIGTFRLFTSLQSARIIIQRTEDVERVADTAFGLELILSGVAFVVAFLLAGPIMRGTEEWFFERELQVAALGLIAGPLMLPKVLLEKRLDFLRASLVTLIGVVFGIVLQIGLALLGLGLWALIAGNLMGQFASCVVAWTFSPYRPKPRFDPALMKDVTTFGLPLAMSAALSYFYWNVDDVMVKLIMGTAALGYYSKSFRLPHYGFRIQAALSTLVYPAFSATRDEEHLCRAYGHAIRYSAYLLVLPVVMVLSHGREIVIVLFGERWLPITVPFKIFTALVGVRGIFNHWVDLYISRGKTRLVTVLAVANSVLIMGLGYWGVNAAGLLGISLAVLVTICTTVLVALIMIQRTHPVDYPKLLGPAVIAGAAALIFGGLLRGQLPAGTWGLFGTFVGMAVIYGLVLILLDRDAVITLWRAAWARFREQ